jgi:protein-tyrosine-phosphatase
VAEALLKKLKPEIDVDSAGTNPVVPHMIAIVAKEYLVRKNADQYLKKTPEGLSEKGLDKYDLIVTMESRHKDVILRKCPECENKIVVWNVDDPYFLPTEYAERIFNQIKDKIAELANSL